MRLTIHNARAGKDGVFSVKHNDRRFNLENAEHIDPERSSDNTYWHWYHSESPQMTFEDAEKRFYEETFTEALEAQNERHRKARHKERIKTMDEYRKSKQTCPEETIYQVGKEGDTIDPELFKKILVKQLRWEINAYPNMKILDYAIHNDEQGAPHAHVRRIWGAVSDDGIIVSQSKALEAMGIERPDPSKKKTRTNNPKKTITQQIRDHCIKLCESYGIEIEKEPQDASKVGLDLLTYKANQEKAKASKAKEEAEQAEDSKAKALKDKEDAENSKNLTLQETSDLEAKNKNLKDKNKNLKAENKELQDDNEALCSDYNDLVKDYDDLVRREQEVQKKEEELNRKSKNMKSFIDSKVKEQFDQQVEKVLKPVALTGEAERIQKYMKNKGFENGKTLYDYYQQDLRYEVNQNLKQYKSQQKQQQKTNNDYFQEYQQSQDTKDYDDFLTNDEYWQNFGDYDDIIKNDEYWQNLEDYDNLQF